MPTERGDRGVRPVRIAVSFLFAFAVFLLLNEFGPYKRHDGPIMLKLGRTGAVHAGDLLVLVVSFGAALWVASRSSVKRPGAR